MVSIIRHLRLRAAATASYRVLGVLFLAVLFSIASALMAFGILIAIKGLPAHSGDPAGGYIVGLPLTLLGLFCCTVVGVMFYYFVRDFRASREQ